VPLTYRLPYIEDVVGDWMRYRGEEEKMQMKMSDIYDTAVLQADKVLTFYTHYLLNHAHH
jgi:hypothetical protein